MKAQKGTGLMLRGNKNPKLAEGILAFMLGAMLLCACSPASTMNSASRSAQASDWSQIREIAHESRRAEIAFASWQISDVERREALAVAVKCADAMMATRDVGLTPSRRIYKYQYLGKSHLFAASFSPRDEEKIDHIMLADEALRRAVEAERDVRIDATWNDADRSQFAEAKAYTAFLRAVVRALQLKLGRATPAQVDEAIEAIPAEYKKAHPPDFDQTLHEYLSKRTRQ